jgi:hypothetical protein
LVVAFATIGVALKAADDFIREYRLLVGHHQVRCTVEHVNLPRSKNHTLLCLHDSFVLLHQLLALHVALANFLGMLFLKLAEPLLEIALTMLNFLLQAFPLQLFSHEHSLELEYLTLLYQDGILCIHQIIRYLVHYLEGGITFTCNSFERLGQLLDCHRQRFKLERLGGGLADFGTKSVVV